MTSRLVSETHCICVHWAAFHLAVSPSQHVLEVPLWHLVCIESVLDCSTILYWMNPRHHQASGDIASTSVVRLF